MPWQEHWVWFLRYNDGSAREEAPGVSASPLLVGCSTSHCCYYQPWLRKRSRESQKRWRAENICSPWTTWVWIETLPRVPHSFIPLTNTRSGDKYQIKEGSFSSSPQKDSCASACSEILFSFVAAVEIILPIWMGSCYRSARGRILLLLFIITVSQLCSDWLDRFENPWILIILTSDVSLWLFSCFEFRFQVNHHIPLAPFRCVSAPIIDTNYC